LEQQGKTGDDDNTDDKRTWQNRSDNNKVPDQFFNHAKLEFINEMGETKLLAYIRDYKHEKIEKIENPDENNEAKAHILHQIGITLVQEERYSEAQRIIEAEVEFRHKLFPEGILNLARSLSLLAQVMKELGDRKACKSLEEEALEFKRYMFRDIDEEVADSLEMLG
jgi:hypothetical protein